MSPREIAEKLHDHYCVQECRWHDKPGTILAGEAEITEAIDAATKPLREEVERLRPFETALERCQAGREELFQKAARLSRDWQQAEASNRALVEALEKAEQRNARQAVIIGDCPRCTLAVIETDDVELDKRATDFRKRLAADRAALAAAHEERSKADTPDPAATPCRYCGTPYVRSENIHQCSDGGKAMRDAFGKDYRLQKPNVQRDSEDGGGETKEP